MTRREFLSTLAVAMAPGALIPTPRKPLRFGAIADIHHGLAPDSYPRLKAFVEAVKRRDDLDFVIQMGDFCHSYPPSEYKPFLELWQTIELPRHHILGNHDLDRGTKDQAMKLWGMPGRFGSFTHGDWRFVYLDLNNFMKEGKLYAYENGNYFSDGAMCNYADPEQLDWLRNELGREKKPTLLFCHQPLAFGDADGKLPPEQLEVLKAIDGHVAAAIFGHCHIDRLESYNGIPCYCLNSASYFWQSGMHPYKDPLFAFIELGTDGILRVEGRQSTFSRGRPKTDAIGCSASIDDRRFRLR